MRHIHVIHPFLVLLPPYHCLTVRFHSCLFVVSIQHQIPLITPNLNKSQYNTTNEHLFSVHSNYQFTVSALVELLNYYAWDSIALLYTQSSDNDLCTFSS